MSQRDKATEGPAITGGEQSARHTVADLLRMRPRHRHDHPPIRNVNVSYTEQLTLGQRIADGFAAVMGSWRFIIAQSCLLTVWVLLNALAWIRHWDPYPFILLNLALSFQAAYAAPIIMMSQNRQALKDRLAAEHDFEINTKAEDEVRAILHHLEYQDTLLLQMLARLEARSPDGPDAPARG